MLNKNEEIYVYKRYMYSRTKNPWKPNVEKSPLHFAIQLQKHVKRYSLDVWVEKKVFYIDESFKMSYIAP